MTGPWICSGQSNMQWKLAQTPQGLGEAESLLPQLRLLSIETPPRLGRQTATGARWVAADRQSLAMFSAVGGWFGRVLQQCKRRSKFSPRNRSGEPVVAETNQAIALRT